MLYVLQKFFTLKSFIFLQNHIGGAVERTITNAAYFRAFN